MNVRLKRYFKLTIFIILLSFVFLPGCSPKKEVSEVSPPSNTKIRENIHTSPEEMVEVPAGEYLIGSGKRFESAERKVKLEAFKIDKHPVTLRQYLEFVNKTGYGWVNKNLYSDPEILKERGDYPVTDVTLQDAQDYAKWAGKRLPTEAEWEAAAGGAEGYVYPWGNEWDETALDPASKEPHPVGQYPNGKSFCGAEDFVGNVFHWTVEPAVPDLERLSPEQEKGVNIIKGGAWTYFPHYNRVAFRTLFGPQFSSPYIGFRCVLPSDHSNDKNLKQALENPQKINRDGYESTEALRQLLSFELNPRRRLSKELKSYIESIPKGSTVADVGVGIGFLTYRLSPAVGKKGEVLAVDISESVLEFTKTVSEKEGMTNIRTLHNVRDDVKIKENTCDYIFLMGTIGHVDAQIQKPFIKSCRKGLKNGGRLVIVDTKREGSVNDIFRVITDTGFELKEDIDMDTASNDGYNFIKTYVKK